ncbi:hypothetical protein PQR52_01580 [Paraburkholderia aspalathi]|uniref:hypothetical protein n=1 Tax=Paraburkholderia aspalathi TaxID=1324617 RepID=UPI0038BBC82E
MDIVTGMKSALDALEQLGATQTYQMTERETTELNLLRAIVAGFEALQAAWMVALQTGGGQS